jgi:hypothetical protein
VNNVVNSETKNDNSTSATINANVPDTSTEPKLQNVVTSSSDSDIIK